jgi:hypothetical protein
MSEMMVCMRLPCRIDVVHVCVLACVRASEREGGRKIIEHVMDDGRMCYDGSM